MSRVTFSFDNGPDLAGTRLVFATLADFGIKASFFVVASRLEDPKLRALAEEAQANGHWIGNHTLSHYIPLGADPDAAAPAHEIGAAQDCLATLSHPDRLFRPHGGGGLLAQGHEIVQEFPPSCVPVRRGRQIGSLEGVRCP